MHAFAKALLIAGEIRSAGTGGDEARAGVFAFDDFGERRHRWMREIVRPGAVLLAIAVQFIAPAPQKLARVMPAAADVVGGNLAEPGDHLRVIGRGVLDA